MTHCSLCHRRVTINKCRWVWLERPIVFEFEGKPIVIGKRVIWCDRCNDRTEEIKRLVDGTNNP